MKNLLRRFLVRKKAIKAIPETTELEFDWSHDGTTTIVEIDFEAIDMATLEAEIDAFSMTFRKNK